MVIIIKNYIKFRQEQLLKHEKLDIDINDFIKNKIKIKWIFTKKIYNFKNLQLNK